MLEKETYSSKKVCETRSFLRTRSMLFCQSLRFFPTVWMFFAHSPKNLWIQNFYQKFIKCSKVGCEQVKNSFDEPLEEILTESPKNVVFRFSRELYFFSKCCRPCLRYIFDGLWKIFHRKFKFFCPGKKMKDTNKIPKHFSPKVSPGHVECSFDNSAETFFPKRPKGFSSKWKKFLKLNFSPKKNNFSRSNLVET